MTKLFFTPNATLIHILMKNNDVDDLYIHFSLITGIFRTDNFAEQNNKHNYIERNKIINEAGFDTVKDETITVSGVFSPETLFRLKISLLNDVYEYNFL